MNKQNAVYVGNLDIQVTEDILWELFLQVSRVKSVRFPKKKIPGKIYAFVELENMDEAKYAVNVLNLVQLFGKSIRVAPAKQSKDKIKNIGAILFIGNIATEVNEKLLYDTFSSFGEITQVPSIPYDNENGVRKGYAFIGFGSFAASDAAIQYMNGQLMCNKVIKVQYALRKGSKERHGSQAERLLAAEAEKKELEAKAKAFDGNNENNTSFDVPPAQQHSNNNMMIMG
jgi:splicing factor 3B subunit 4